MVRSRFHDIKPGLDNSIAYFLRCGKRWITADSIMTGSKNRFLIDHGYVCRLDLIQNMRINMIIIPYAGVIFTGFIQLAVI